MAVRVGIDLTQGTPHRVAVDRRLGGVRVLPQETPGPCTVALPARLLTFRALTMPFSDRRRLDGLVEQELSSNLAFGLHEAAWDYTIFSEVEPGEPNVFAIACPETRMHQSLQPLETRAAQVDAEPLAYQRVLLLAGIRDGIILDIGDERTVLGRVRRGNLDFVRVLTQGRTTLRARTAAALGLTISEATERLGVEGTAIGIVADTVEQWLQESLLPSTPAEASLWLAGPGGNLPGLAEHVARILQRKVAPLPMPEGLSPWEDAVALGMALSDLRNGQSVHLEKQETTRRPVHLQVAIWLAFAAALWAVDQGAQAWSVRRQLQAYDDAILAIARKAAPSAQIRSMPVQRLQSLVAQRTTGTAPGGRPALEVLEAVSEALTKTREGQRDGVLKVFELRYDGHELRLQGEAASFQRIESLHRGLDGLGKVSEESTRAAGSTSTFSYTMRVHVEGP